MKYAPLFALALSTVSAAALASTDPKAVPGIDKTREGDLAKKVAAFYQSTKPVGCDADYGLTTFSATKLGSGSSMDEKVENSTMTYEATYLAVSICNTGSTFSGAYREVMDAAIISASRFGRVKNGGAPLVASEPDTFKIVRKIDPKLLSAAAE